MTKENMQQPEQKKEKADASASIDKKESAAKMVSDLKAKLEQMPEGQIPEGLMEQMKTMEEKINSGEMVSPDELDKMTEEAENAFFQAGEKINQAGVAHAMKQESVEMDQHSPESVKQEELGRYSDALAILEGGGKLDKQEMKDLKGEFNLGFFSGKGALIKKLREEIEALKEEGVEDVDVQEMTDEEKADFQTGQKRTFKGTQARSKAVSNLDKGGKRKIGF